VRGSTVGSLRTLNIASEMWIGGFDLKSKPKSIRGRRNEDTEMKAISSGFIGIYFTILIIIYLFKYFMIPFILKI
jgi:hypothetical protein